MVELGLALSIFGAVLGFCPWSSEPFVATKLLLVLAGAAVSLAALCFKPRQGMGCQQVLILIWSFIVLSTIMFSCDPIVSLIGAGDSSQGSFISFLALGLAFSAAQMSGLSAKRLGEYSIAACCVCAAYAVLQRAGVDPLFAGYHAEFGGRAFSTMGGPILLGPVLAAGLALAVGQRRTAAAALILAGLLATGTRAAIGGGLAGAVLAACLSERISVRLAAAGAGAAVLAAILSRAGALVSDVGRFALWKISWQGFLDHPLAGWGANTFGIAMRQYIDADYLGVNGALLTHSHAHNLVLQTLFSHGLAGLVGLTFVALFGLVLWSGRRHEDAPAIGAAAAVLLCAQTNPVPLAGWLIGLICLAPLAGAISQQLAPRRVTIAAAAAAVLLVGLQARLVRSELETRAGRQAWNEHRGLEAANHFNRAARLNPWSSEVIAAQLDSSRNLIPWMPLEQAERTAADGLRIAERNARRHPADARAHETLTAQLALSALLERDERAKDELLDRAEFAAFDAQNLAPTFPPVQQRASAIAGARRTN